MLKFSINMLWFLLLFQVLQKIFTGFPKPAPVFQMFLEIQKSFKRKACVYNVNYMRELYLSHKIFKTVVCVSNTSFQYFFFSNIIFSPYVSNY